MSGAEYLERPIVSEMAVSTRVTLDLLAELEAAVRTQILHAEQRLDRVEGAIARLEQGSSSRADLDDMLGDGKS